ncbi:MAG: tRNA (adenosine(37)-N6)-dimethylallyltransferase MiaA [Gammaproteobacteria bacterium]
MSDATVFALVGPTAAGKTAVALELAARFPVALISLDSAQVYRGMDIGSAKPTPEELARFPHALIDIRDPSEAYSVAEFLTDADAAVQAALNAGRIPLLVGGTMLYLRAFREGLAVLPPVDAAVREALAAEAATRGLPALHAELAAVDPHAAAGIHPNNPQRLLRALEVWRQTGRPLSAWWARQPASDVAARLGVGFEAYAVLPESRLLLHQRIEQRLSAMFDAGFLDEVRALRRRGDLHAGLPSLRAVGYRQAWAYLDGALAADALQPAVLAATRQLARRQLTWLRSFEWVSAASVAATRNALAARLAERSGVAVRSVR